MLMSSTDFCCTKSDTDGMQLHSLKCTVNRHLRLKINEQRDTIEGRKWR